VSSPIVALLGFSKPTVENRNAWLRPKARPTAWIDVPMTFSNGTVVIRATKELFSQMSFAVLSACGEVPRRKDIRGRRYEDYPPATIAAYERTLALWNQEDITQVEACARCGVSLPSFAQWRFHTRKRRALESAGQNVIR
jgi:hypothetical protein